MMKIPKRKKRKSSRAVSKLRREFIAHLETEMRRAAATATVLPNPFDRIERKKAK